MVSSVISSTICSNPITHTQPQVNTASKVDLRPSALSIDTVNICNLRCKHCYWDEYDETIQSKVNPKLLDNVKEVLDKYSTITNITWYGGEPLVNEFSRNLVQEGIRLNKKNNLVITNGTIRIPDWYERTHFAVSIDGDQPIHEHIRGKGNYLKSRNNILDAVKRKIPVGIIYCLNSINVGCIEKFLSEWIDTGIDGVTFTCYAPMKNKPSQLAISDEQRECVVDVLFKMKAKYGKFIYNTNMMIELIRAKYSEEIANNCPMNVKNENGRVFSIHMCNNGSIRVPCALGDEADCMKCRSVTTLAIYAGMVKRDRESRRALFGMYHSRTHK